MSSHNTSHHNSDSTPSHTVSTSRATHTPTCTSHTTPTSTCSSRATSTPTCTSSATSTTSTWATNGRSSRTFLWGWLPTGKPQQLLKGVQPDYAIHQPNGHGGRKNHGTGGLPRIGLPSGNMVLEPKCRPTLSMGRLHSSVLWQVATKGECKENIPRVSSRTPCTQDGGR